MPAAGNEALSERRVLDLLVEAARRLKWSLNYRGSKDTNDFAQQAFENLLRRGRRDELSGDSAEVGALLWTAARNAILDEKRRVRGNAGPGEVKRPPPAKREALDKALAEYEHGSWRRAPKPEERQRHVAFFRAALDGDTHEAIAARFHVTRETVTKKLAFVCAWLNVRLAARGDGR
jgi:hypothetical protein